MPPPRHSVDEEAWKGKSVTAMVKEAASSFKTPTLTPGWKHGKDKSLSKRSSTSGAGPSLLNSRRPSTIVLPAHLSPDAPMPVPTDPRVQKLVEMLETPRSWLHSPQAQIQTSRKRISSRLTNPQHRLLFIRDHPFFSNTGIVFREKLAPRLVRRSAALDNATVVLQQGAEPDADTDYLFLTGPNSSAKIEIIFDGQVISMLGSSAVFGQEIVFNVTKQFLFTAKVIDGAANSIWVIPRGVLDQLMAQEEHADEAATLRARAHSCMVNIMHRWYARPMSQVRFRLFDNAEHPFRMALVRAMELNFFMTGSTICKEGEHPVGEPALLCVLRGEATLSVAKEGVELESLCDATGTSAWAPWWGLLETLGVCETCPATVTAKTDCAVYTLTAESLKHLRTFFSLECRLFDKVGVEHLKALQETAPKLTSTPAFTAAGPGADFLKGLEDILDSRVLMASEVVFRADDPGSDMYFIARGHIGFWHPGKLAGKADFSMKTGDFFGERAALGITNTRSVSAFAETLADLRVLNGQKLVTLLRKYPAEGWRMLEICEKNALELVPGEQKGGHGPKLSELPMFAGFGLEFCFRLAEIASGRLDFIGSVIMEQGKDQDNVYIITLGSVNIHVDGIWAGRLSAPMIIGEHALARQGVPSVATVTCASFMRCRVISAARGRKVVERYPEDSVKLSKMADENVGRICSMIERHDSFDSRDSTPMKRRMECSRAEMRRSFTTQISDSSERDTQPRRMSGTRPVDRCTIDWLKGTSMYQDSDPEFLELLLRNMEYVTYVDGELVLEEADEGDFAILIHEGTCNVEVGDTRVGEVQSGGLVGEIALLAALLGSSAKRVASVRAVGTVSAYTMGVSAFQEAFLLFPREEQRMMNMALQRQGVLNHLTSTEGKKPRVRVSLFGGSSGSDDGSPRPTLCRLPTFGAPADAEGEDRFSSRRASKLHRSSTLVVRTSTHDLANTLQSLRRNLPMKSPRVSLLATAPAQPQRAGEWGVPLRSPRASMLAQRRQTVAAGQRAYIAVKAAEGSDDSGDEGKERKMPLKRSQTGSTGSTGLFSMRAAMQSMLENTAKFHTGSDGQSDSPGSDSPGLMSRSRQPSQEFSTARRDSPPSKPRALYPGGPKRDSMLTAGGLPPVRRFEDASPSFGSALSSLLSSSPVSNTNGFDGDSHDESDSSSASSRDDHESSSPPEGGESSPRSSNRLSSSRVRNFEQLLEMAEQGSDDESGSGTVTSTSEKPLSPSQTWAKKRTEAIEAVESVRTRQLCRSGRLLPLVPSDRGTVSGVRERSLFGAGSPTPSRQRFKRAKGLYAPPVWHELFM